MSEIRQRKPTGAASSPSPPTPEKEDSKRSTAVPSPPQTITLPFLPSLIFVLLLAVLLPFYALYLSPLIDLTGLFRTRDSYKGVNNEKCHKILGLESCEDMYIHRESGLAYLVCGDKIERRTTWFSGLFHLDSSKDKFPIGEDSIYMLDLSTEKVTQITLTNLAGKDFPGLTTHGLDAFFVPGSKKVSFFVTNHRLPPEGKDGKEWGADSVIEIFDTEVGSNQWKHIQTVRDPMIKTPNSLVAVGEREFYVTNDHFDKTSDRSKEAFFRMPRSDIVYCSVSSPSQPPKCLSATDEYHPNGLTKGPDNKIYVTSTLGGYIASYEIQSSHELIHSETWNVRRILDNVYVSPSGAIYVTSISSGLLWTQLTSLEGQRNGVRSPTEVYRVINETNEERFYGNPTRIEKIFSDNGDLVSGTTAAAPWNGKLYLTGLLSEYVSVCEFPVDFEI